MTRRRQKRAWLRTGRKASLPWEAQTELAAWWLHHRQHWTWAADGFWYGAAAADFPRWGWYRYGACPCRRCTVRMGREG